MKTNEIKETKEVVIRTEYVAEDGEIFYSADECRKYEESALFAVSNKLKKIKKPNGKDFTHYDFIEECNDEDIVEVFDIKDKEDLLLLARYLKLKLTMNGASESSIDCCFKAGGKRDDYVFKKVTPGHEVIIFYNYDMDWFWVYGDGSIDGFINFHKNKITKLIYPESKEN